MEEIAIIKKMTCPKHGETDFVYSKTEDRYRCKQCRLEAVSKRRRYNKEILVEYKGGKCEICGYSKCIDALEFHHLNPKEKRFGIGCGDTKGIDELKKEVDKCILVCSNCHKEIHAKIRQQEEIEKQIENERNVKIYNRTHNVYNKPCENDINTIKELIKQGLNNSEICEQLNYAFMTIKSFRTKYGIVNDNSKPKLDGYTIEKLKEDLSELGTFSGIGRKYGVSPNAIKKWCFKNNLPSNLIELKENIKNNLI